jgi:hypothetical protein
MTASSHFPGTSSTGEVVLDGKDVLKVRHCLHELANVFTGVMIASGLLGQHLEGGSLEHYATDIGAGSERGSALVREIRRHLLDACGEIDAAPDAGSPEELQDGQERH